MEVGIEYGRVKSAMKLSVAVLLCIEMGLLIPTLLPLNLFKSFLGVDLLLGTTQRGFNLRDLFHYISQRVNHFLSRADIFIIRGKEEIIMLVCAVSL